MSDFVSRTIFASSCVQKVLFLQNTNYDVFQEGALEDMRPVPEEFLLDIAATIFAAVKEPMDSDELVAFCKCIKNGTQFKNARDRHRRLVSSCLSENTNEFFLYCMNTCDSIKSFFGFLCVFGVFIFHVVSSGNPNSGKCELVKAPVISEKDVDDLCNRMLNACSNAASGCIGLKSGCRPPANEKVRCFDVAYNICTFLCFLCFYERNALVSFLYN